MTKTKKQLVDMIYSGNDPFQGFDDWESKVDDFELWEWGSKHEFLHDSIEKTNALICVDQGSWKGGSAIHMALKLKEKGDGCVIAIDSWLCCHLLFKHAAVQGAIKRKFGRPNIWESFYANCIKYGVKDFILPIHMDSQSGYRLLNGKHRDPIKVTADVVYVDGAHYSPMVYMDLSEAHELVRPGGHIIVDDFVPGQVTVKYDGADFTGVYSDTTKFCTDHNLSYEYSPYKARIVKR